MTYNKHLREKIEEWTERLYIASYEGINAEWAIYWKKINETPVLKAIIQQALDKAALPEGFSDTLRKELPSGRIYSFNFASEEHRAASLFMLLNDCLTPVYKEFNNAITYLGSGDYFDSQKNEFLSTYVNPLIHYLSDKLEKENGILYLLERYKRRTEWFFKESLLSQYKTPGASYEKIFENDLRLFLFNQGVNYPLSTPHSASGRADVVGLLESDEPLVLEIKIWDSHKGYTKSRIRQGLNQIVQYANDYNKETGYLVIFNCDNIEIEIESEDSKLNFPNRIVFNNKTYYIVIVNLYNELTASKRGSITKEKIAKEDLTDSFGSPTN